MRQPTDSGSCAYKARRTAPAAVRFVAGKHTLLLICLLAPGCMIPNYHEPAGFSSTFHRQLYRKQHTLVQKEVREEADDAATAETDQKPKPGIFSPISQRLRVLPNQAPQPASPSPAK